MIAVVFDCNVILQAMLRRESPAFACLEGTERKNVRIQISAELLTEYRDVLSRDELCRKFPILKTAFIDEQFQQILARSDYWELVSSHVTLSRDPKDEPYLNLAVESNARYLVSRDRDLLDLMQDVAFTSAHPDLTICDPAQFLTILDALESTP